MSDFIDTEGARMQDFKTDEARWLAVASRDHAADGAFWYGVRTTGVFCRPACPSRRAKRENVAFHASIAEAEAHGFRACLRCRPLEAARVASDFPM